MLKTLKRIIQSSKEKYRIPRSVRDLIPIDVIWKDGIFKRGNLFNKTFIYTDINFESASEENKGLMFLKYSSVLNSFDSQAITKMTICNRQMTRNDFEESVLAKLEGDELDDFRQEYNNLLSELALVDNGIMQEKYITVSVARRDIKAAREYFTRMEVELRNRFAELGSVCRPLDAKERLRIFHNFYRSKESDQYHLDLDHSMRFGHDVRDYICPNSIEKYSKEYLRNPSLSELSQQFHFSKNHILNVFKSSYQQTPLEYIHHLKLSRAEYLLEVTSESIERISYSSGFHNYSQFYRLFFRKNNVSPSYWRKNKRLEFDAEPEQRSEIE